MQPLPPELIQGSVAAVGDEGAQFISDHAGCLCFHLLEQRLESTIFKSEIFAPLFKQKPDLLPELRRKIVPIAGDLIVDKLGLSAEDRATVCEEADIIINSAASVSFDEPLLDAIQINYFGCQRMLQLAKECRKLLCYTHVSTAYVNSNILGNPKVDEKVYDLPGN